MAQFSSKEVVRGLREVLVGASSNRVGVFIRTPAFEDDPDEGGIKLTFTNFRGTKTKERTVRGFDLFWTEASTVVDGPALLADLEQNRNEEVQLAIFGELQQSRLVVSGISRRFDYAPLPPVERSEREEAEQAVGGENFVDGREL